MKRVMIMICFTLLSFSLFSRTEVRLLANVETVLGDSVEDTFEQYEDNLKNLYGFSWEVIMNHIGIGMHYGVLFESFDDEIFDDEKEWWMDWKGDIYLSYHLFGADSFIDPFIEIGAGNCGRTYIGSTAEYYNDFDNRLNNESNVTNMSIFPFAAIGGSINLNGFVIGAKANYIMSNNDIPGTNFDEYSLENTSLTIFTGLSL